MTATAAFRIERRDAGFLAHVDLRHDFYFDHPLGHLPGLLLLDVALAAVAEARVSAAPPWFAQFDIAFRAIAALHRPLEIELFVGSAADRTTRCTLSQGGRLCAEAQVTEGEDAQPGAAPMPAEAAFAALDPRSIRKARPENVFLGQAGAGAAIQLPHRLASALPASDRGRYAPVYLAECFLQLCRRGGGGGGGGGGRGRGGLK
ncbi:AfsA-related hotdog domain-containing protein, partial [Inquilinus sp. OTU3971]|uniref:AfsA-related hotdog domain-containing protein n=1 Tax=Inquilinus sp. OTU3971 TaxID=3043855 RepID=UPI00313C77A9